MRRSRRWVVTFVLGGFAGEAFMQLLNTYLGLTKAHAPRAYMALCGFLGITCLLLALAIEKLGRRV